VSKAILLPGGTGYSFGVWSFIISEWLHQLVPVDWATDGFTNCCVNRTTINGDDVSLYKLNFNGIDSPTTIDATQ